MRKKPIILTVSIVLLLVLLVYVAIFSPSIENSLIFIFIIIGSLSVVSASTIYTVVTHTAMEDDRIRESKKFKKPTPKVKEMSIKKIQGNLIDDYIDAIPSIREYVESDKSYEELPVMDKLIFSKFDSKILEKIDLLGLSKMEKLEFLRELVYFDPEERESLIENMLINRGKRAGEVDYVAPLNPIQLLEKIRIHVISLIEPSSFMKVMIAESLDMLGELKEKIGLLFGYNTEEFLLSSGGIILNDENQLIDYNIADDDEIVIIPKRKK